MSITYGKWESKLTIPTGNWTCSLVESYGPTPEGADTITLTAAKTYYHSSAGNDSVDLPAKLKALLDAASLGATYTVTVDAIEAGTGRYTISATGGGLISFAITWTSTDLRDVLGFTATLTGALTYTSTNSAEGLWLPNGPPLSLTALDDPIDESDETVLEAPGGVSVHRLVYDRKYVHTDLLYQGLSRAKTRIAGETYGNESFQWFYRNCIQGDTSYWELSEVRIYPDAATDATYDDWWVAAMREFKPEAMSTGYQGLWNVRIPRLIQKA